jgi:hypothetical protein
MNARLSAIFCHWPMLSSRPFLNHRPSCVSKPSGSPSTTGRAKPLSAASAQRSRSPSAATSPTPMFSPTLSWIAHEVLKDHADPPPQRAAVPRAQIQPVQHDPPRVGLVQPGQQLDERRLARPVLAHQRQLAARRQVKGSPRAPRLLGARVGEGHVLEAQPVRQASAPAPHRPTSAGVGCSKNAYRFDR